MSELHQTGVVSGPDRHPGSAADRIGRDPLTLSTGDRSDLDWIAVTDEALPVDEVVAWVSRPDCGAIVSFVGMVRDHSEGRPAVTALEYEVYPEHAVPKLREVAATSRERWPMIGRLALLHRVGRLAVGEASVAVAVSTPHRGEAFDAAEYCIDTLKHTVPVWKLETWAGGTNWSECAHDIGDIVP
jgi:molybdopterin synthase catalytic subunit